MHPRPLHRNTDPLSDPPSQHRTSAPLVLPPAPAPLHRKTGPTRPLLLFLPFLVLPSEFNTAPTRHTEPAHAPTRHPSSPPPPSRREIPERPSPRIQRRVRTPSASRRPATLSSVRAPRQVRGSATCVSSKSYRRVASLALYMCHPSPKSREHPEPTPPRPLCVRVRRRGGRPRRGCVAPRPGVAPLVLAHPGAPRQRRRPPPGCLGRQALRGRAATRRRRSQLRSRRPRRCRTRSRRVLHEQWINFMALWSSTNQKMAQRAANQRLCPIFGSHEQPINAKVL
jgi:hypothetical protein